MPQVVHLASYQLATAGQHRNRQVVEGHLQAQRDLDSVIAKAALARANAAYELAGTGIDWDAVPDGTIIERLLGALSVTTGKIADAAITARVVAAESIVAKALTISNFENLWPNGTSEQSPPTGADATTSEWAGRYNAGAGAYAGSWVRRLVLGVNDGQALAHRVPCIPGEQFYLLAMVRQASGDLAEAGTGAAVAIRFFDGSDSQVGATARSGWTTATSYQASSVSATAPAQAVRVEFALEGASSGSPPESGTLYFDGIFAKRKSDGSLIVDGAITADKIATGAITAGKISADAIKTSNFASTGSGTSEVATAGAKMQSDGTALLVAPGNLKIGSLYFSGLGVIQAQGHFELYEDVNGDAAYSASAGLNVQTPTREAATQGLGPAYITRIPMGYPISNYGAIHVTVTGSTKANWGKYQMCPIELTSTHFDLGLFDGTAWVDPNNFGADTLTFCVTVMGYLTS